MHPVVDQGLFKGHIMPEMSYCITLLTEQCVKAWWHLEEHGRRVLHAHGDPAALKAPARVVPKARLPHVRQLARRAAGHPAQQRKQLRAVADAQAEGVRAAAEGQELLPEARIAPDGARPALGAVQHVRVAEAAHRHQAREVVQARPPGQQVLP